MLRVYGLDYRLRGRRTLRNSCATVFCSFTFHIVVNKLQFASCEEPVGQRPGSIKPRVKSTTRPQNHRHAEINQIKRAESNGVRIIGLW